MLEFGRLICFLLLLAVSWKGMACGESTVKQLTENQCVYHTLPTEVIDRLLTSTNATLSHLESLGGQTTKTTASDISSCKDSPSLDTFSKLLLLFLDKVEKEQDRLWKEVSTLKEALKESQDRTSSECSCPQSPQQSSTSIEVLLAAVLQLQQDVRAQKQQPGDPSTSNLMVTPHGQECPHSSDRPKDCYELAQQGKNESGVYIIYPYRCGRRNDGVSVWCDLEGEDAGWTVVLSRRPLDEQVNFNRGWRDYRIGFGDPETEHWIGNDALHAITSQAKQVLHVDMKDWDGAERYAEYNTFTVEDEDSEYRLHLGGFTGNGGDALSYHSNMPFTTSDRDNDLHGSNCAILFDGGFWYNACHHVSATSPLLEKQQSTKGINWSTWYTDRTTLKEMHFKVKPVPCIGMN